MDCVFCAIASGGAEASIVWSDDRTLAFMDIAPVAEGHVLVIPRTHVPQIFDLDERDGAAVMATTVRVARAVRALFQPDGLNLWQSNGEAAGQEVPHFHFHVVPRWRGDDLIRLQRRPTATPARAELDRRAREIGARIDAG